MSSRFSEYCASCKLSLASNPKILFVEKEIGRCFCSETCIIDYFQPTVDFFEEMLVRLRTDDDVSILQFDHYVKYRLTTLKKPDEVWVKRSETGDAFYTFISKHTEAEKTFYYVVLALCLDGEPSFVFLSFPTRDPELIQAFREGSTELLNKDAEELPEKYLESIDSLTPKLKMPDSEPDGHLPLFERVLLDYRSPQDIPTEDFHHFEEFIEMALEDPDEIWAVSDQSSSYANCCIFIARFSDESNSTDFHMIVVAVPEEVDGRKTLSVALAFPTIDLNLVHHFRKGINSMNRAFGIASQLAA